MKKLSYQKTLKSNVNEVWNALTSQASLASWLMANNFLPVEGSEFSFEEMGTRITGRVIEVQNCEKLSLLWISALDNEDGPGTPSVLTWTLNPTETGGTSLSLEQDLLEPAQPVVLIEAAVNWSFAIHCSLPNFLREKPKQPVPIVYATVESNDHESSLRRAGFRQPLVNA